MTVLLDDNFDSYSNGDLNGNGGWIGATTFDVQGTIVQSGAKAVLGNMDTSNRIIEHGLTDSADGYVSCYIRAAQTNRAGGYTLYNQSDAFLTNIHFRNDGNIKYYDGSAYVTIQAYSANTWYKVDAEWKGSTSEMRFRIDDGTWTAWDTVGSFSAISKIALNTANTGTGSMYFDELYVADEVPVAEEKRNALYFGGGM